MEFLRKNHTLSIINSNNIDGKKNILLLKIVSYIGINQLNLKNSKTT